MKKLQFAILVLLLGIDLIFTVNMPLAAQNKPSKPEATKPPTQKAKPIIEGLMSVEKMGTIIRRLDKDVKVAKKGVWNFKIEKVPVFIVTDIKQNRMRILVPIRKANEVSDKELKRLMQANFDSALDSRYAIGKEILWATFIHSLSTLHERQFISAIGQTVNIALTYGTTYSSGALVYGGGDSQGILRRQLIDKLLKKGLPI